ncbi:hypothetical protein HPP92_023750 [Vanilla planifolia]|uniref:Uncharacterized protein n=1 Tax=Vanilla planifolia TaxID=51239 RepID=A0A835PTE6_VANPL|nr:hypothetical protein HPP92_023750 [Vanilla planifolia]
MASQESVLGLILWVNGPRVYSKEEVFLRLGHRTIFQELMDAQGSGVARTSGPLERDKDMFKPINSSAVQVEENDRVFSNVADGWERSKMRKKRSVIKSDASTSSGLIKSQGVDRETKRGMQQKLGIDARPRAYYANTFRPGSDSSAPVIGKSDLSTQQTSLNMRSRSEQNISSIPNERREARFCPDVENGSLRVINKSNNREDNCAATPTLLKFGSARPRSNSTSISKTSPSINRVVGNSEDMESSQTVDKFNAIGAMNRKRSTSLRSSSPPVGQWAVQRPQKISRSSRRSSLSPLVSNHDELAISETIEEGTINHDASILRRAPSSASQQNKLRGDHFAIASLSESEESGVQENKVKDKVKKCADMEDKPSQTVQKFTNLIASSRKMAVEEDGGDIDRRQGRIGRGFASARSGGSTTFEKIGDGVTTKQQRSIRHGSERVESKPGRPPIKKLTERKSITRPRQSINILSLESSDEAADDHEELVAAATSAIDAGRVCSGSFWKQVEPVFGFVSTEDLAFLHEQIQLTNDAAAIISDEAEDSQNLKVDQEHFSLSSAPTVTTRSESNAMCNGFNFYEHQRETGLTKQILHNGPFADHFLLQSGSCTGVSICQALLSAIIGR